MVIRPKILGWLVIIYVGLKWQTLLSIVGLFVTQNIVSEWPAAIDGIFWFAFLVGGIGLLYYKPWSRWLICSASVGVIVTTIVALVTLKDFILQNSTALLLVDTTISILPAIFFLIAALSIKENASQSGARKSTTRVPLSHRKQRIIAYSSLLFLGLVSLWTAFGLYGDAAADAKAAFIGFFVLIPLGLPMLIALGLLAWFSMKLRDPILISLFVITIIFLIYINTRWNIQIFPLVIYGFINVVFTIVWFATSRRSTD